MPQFEYMVCSVQLMLVTFVNGDWQGSLAPDAPHALESCPTLWEFLEEAGESGWELVSVDSSGNNDLTTLYLKRQKV